MEPNKSITYLTSSIFISIRLQLSDTVGELTKILLTLKCFSRYCL